MHKLTLKNAAEATIGFIDDGIPVMLHGKPGLGKSSLFHQIRTRLSERTGHKWGHVDYRASTRDQVSTMGTPDITGETTRWRVPDEFPQVQRDGEFGLLVLDEFNLADRQTMKAMMGFILDRWVGSYRLPENWQMVAAGNLASDRTNVTALPMALANRFAHIEILQDVDESVMYAIANDWHPAVIGFIGFRGDSLLHNMGDDYSYPTPRNWERVSNICKANRPNDVRRNMIAALVGTEAGAEFEAFWSTYHDLPSLMSCLTNPMQATTPNTAAGLYAVTFGLTHKVTPANFANAVTYMKRLGRSYEGWFMNAVTARDPGLSHTPEFTKWATDPDNQRMINIAA